MTPDALEYIVTLKTKVLTAPYVTDRLAELREVLTEAGGPADMIEEIDDYVLSLMAYAWECGRDDMRAYFEAILAEGRRH